jgi:hypothetical protein
MIEEGDKKSFAIEVCRSMILLFKNNIENFMPENVDVNESLNDQQAMRRNAEKKLTEIMKENGGRYEIIETYIREQEVSSNASQSQAIQYFLLMQRQNPGEDRFFSTPKEKMEEHFLNMCCENPEQYAKTIAMYKAFTAIALNKANFAGKNPQNHTYAVYRGINRDTLNNTYPDYDGKTQYTIKHNPLESTSVGGPISGFNGPGFDTHKMEVPFCRVFFAYFMSAGRCQSAHGFEHEFVCDLHGISATITKN